MNILKRVASSVALVTMLVSVVPTTSVFAATIVDGDLVKASGSSSVYLIQDGLKRVFPHSSVYLSWGYPSNYSTVKTVTASELAVYPDGDAVIYRDGLVFRFQGVGMTGGFDPSAVFYVSDGKVRPIESASAYMKLFNGGVNEAAAWDRVYWIPNDLLAKFTYTKGTLVTASEIDNGILPNGLLAKDSSGLYYVVNGNKLSNITTAGMSANRYLANSNVFGKMLVTKMADSILNKMSAGVPVTAADSSLLTVKKINAGTTTEVATKLALVGDKTSVEADGASQVTLTASVKAASGSTVTNATNAVTFSTTSGLLSAQTVSAVNGIATVRLTPAASATSGTVTVTASASGLTSATVTVTTVANTLAPQVATVSNQGMQILNVVFDKAVDKSTAETTSNYTPKNDKGTTVTVSAAKLLDDGKTVQLKLAAGFYNNATEDSVEVKNVQNVAQTATMSTVTKLMTVNDTSVPAIVAVEALGSKAVRVTFSEALSGVASYGVGSNSDFAAFKMDDKSLGYGTGSDSSTMLNKVAISYPDANDYTKALITFGNGLTVGAHTLTVGSNGSLTDYNVSTTGSSDARTMQAAGYVATVVADTSVPTLSSVEVLSQTKVRYTFSKSVATPVTAAFFYSTSSSATSGTNCNSVAKVSDTVYEATWSSAISTGNMYFFAGVSGSNNVVDYSGNTISPLPSYRQVTVSSDTAPTISSVSMDTDSDRVVIVMFSKDVDETSAETSSNYVFKSSTGVVLTSTTGGNGIGSNGNPVTAPAKDGTNAKKVTLNLGDTDDKALSGATYQLCITNVKATSASSSSSMPTSCYSFTVTDKTRPTLKDNSGAFTIGSNIFAADAGSTTAGRIIVKYSEAMGSSAIDARNYKGYGFTGYTAWTKLSEISGVTLSFRNSNKDVVIDFPNSIDLSTSSFLMVGYIDGSTAYAPTDTSGNLLKTSTTDTNVSVKGVLSTVSSTGLDISVAVTGLVSLKIKSATTFEAVFARPMETVSPSEFTYDNLATSTDTAISNAVICTLANYNNGASTGCDEENEAKVIFTIPSGTSYEFAAGDTDFTLKTIASPSSTKDTLGLIISGGDTDGVSATNNIRPTMKSWVFNSPTQITVAFDGKIEATTGLTNEQNLGYGLILTQTVGATTTTASGTEIIGVDASADSTTIVFNLSKSFDTNTSATLKTLSDGSLIAVGANGARVAANTTGMTNAVFVASSVANSATTYGYGELPTGGYGYGYGTTITVTFNSNVKISSLVSGWTDAKVAKNVDSSIVANADGITFSGFTLGQFKVTGLNAGTYNGSYIFTDSTAAIKTLKVTVYGATADFGMGAGDEITFEPSSSVQNTDGVALTTDFKPAK